LLASGGVVVLPTDTLYGLHAIASSGGALDRIARLKGLPAPRNFVHLAADAESVWCCVEVDSTLRERLAQVWPAPLTAILSGRCGGGQAGHPVAYRVPGNPLLRSLVANLGEFVISTSVNRQGETPLVDPVAIERTFDVDLVVDDGVVDGVASTLIDGTMSPPRVIRQGSYDWAAATGDANPSK